MDTGPVSVSTVTIAFNRIDPSTFSKQRFFEYYRCFETFRNYLAKISFYNYLILFEELSKVRSRNQSLDTLRINLFLWSKFRNTVFWITLSNNETLLLFKTLVKNSSLRTPTILNKSISSSNNATEDKRSKLLFPNLSCSRYRIEFARVRNRSEHPLLRCHGLLNNLKDTVCLIAQRDCEWKERSSIKLIRGRGKYLRDSSTVLVSSKDIVRHLSTSFSLDVIIKLGDRVHLNRS